MNEIIDKSVVLDAIEDLDDEETPYGTEKLATALCTLLRGILVRALEEYDVSKPIPDEYQL